MHWLSAFAAIVAGVVGMLLRVFVLPNVDEASSNPILIGGIVCLVTGGVMALVYAGMLKVLRVEEINALVRTVTRRFRRNVR